MGNCTSHTEMLTVLQYISYSLLMCDTNKLVQLVNWSISTDEGLGLG